MKFTTLALVAAATVTFASPSYAVSLIDNGSFETVDGTDGLQNNIKLNALALGPGGASWDVYATLPGGWYTTSTDPKGFEVQRNTVVAAKEGSHYIELESHDGNPSSLSNILQKFNVGVSGIYELSFWYQPRENQVGDNKIHALFGGIDTVVSGPPDPAFGDWTKIVVQAFFASSVIDYILEFNALGTIDNTLGGFIDLVSIDLVREQATPEVPLPAGLLLLLSGLAGLGFMGRIRAKAAR